MSKVKISILAVTACVLWSTAFAGIKIALPYTTPFFLAGIRFFLAGLLLVPFSGKNYIKTVVKNGKMILFVSLLQTVLMYGLFFTAMNMIPGAVAAIIIGSSPLITATITHFTLKNDRFTRRKVISIIIGIAGIVFVVAGRQSLQGIGARDMGGIGLLLLSVIFSAVGNILVSEKKQYIPPVLLNSAQLALGGITLILLSFLIEGVPSIHIDLTFSLALFWLAFLSAAAFSIWFSLLRIPEVKVSELNMWKFLIPVLGALFSWAVIPSESPNAVSVIGMIIISGSIFFYYFKPSVS